MTYSLNTYHVASASGVLEGTDPSGGPCPWKAEELALCSAGPLTSRTCVSQCDRLTPRASVSSSVITKGLTEMMTNVPSGSPSAMGSKGRLSISINLRRNEALSPGGQKGLIGRVVTKFDFQLGSQAFRRKKSLFPPPSQQLQAVTVGSD